MKVLVTGGLGLLGSLVASQLKNEGFHVDIMDMKIKSNKKRVSTMKRKTDKLFYFGKKNINDILKNDYDIIVHMMQRTPWDTGSAYGGEYESNENAVREIVDGCEGLAKQPSIIYISSTRVKGPTQNAEPPVSTSERDNPVSDYAISKLKCERYISGKDMKHCILRISDVLFTKNDFPENMLLNLFEYPLDARNEMITDLDACTAIVGTVKKMACGDEIEKGTLCIAGGRSNGWQKFNRGILAIMFSAMGIGMLDEGCFNKNTSSFELDWYDTGFSENLLHYQNTDIREYIEIMQANTEKGGAVVKYLAPKIKKRMEEQSPYLK